MQGHVTAIPEDEPAFPKAALLVPPLVPAMVVLLMVLSREFGPHGSGIHGNVGAFLSVALFLSAIAATIVAAFATQSAARLLARYPANRSGANIACLAVSVLYLFAVAAWVVVGALL